LKSSTPAGSNRFAGRNDLKGAIMPDEREPTRSLSQLIDRRSFMRGLQTPAALAVASSLAVRAADPAPDSPPGKGVLERAPVVMIWRRVSSLDNTRKFVNKVLRFPTLGQDPTSIMYDGGGAIVGYSIHEVQPSNDPLYAMCSEVGLQEFAIQNNPASSLVFAPVNFANSAQKLFDDRKSASAPMRTPSGESLSFLDEDGNYSCFQRLSQAALTGDAGTKLHQILRNRWDPPGAQITTVADDKRIKMDKTMDNPMIGIDLMVSDIQAARRFYKDVLGLRPLDSSTGETKFDVGNLVLTLRLEPSNSLVSFLRRSGRLLGDWIVFWTPDIEGVSKELIAKGIKFPAGIEKSPIGDTAYFNDPDGYSLVLWKASGFTKMIDFNPVLNRILKEAGAHLAKA
jgi:catechol 2,3-dioxygenase-like lactoylglutathione lyase family enzyme